MKSFICLNFLHIRCLLLFMCELCACTILYVSQMRAEKYFFSPSFGFYKHRVTPTLKLLFKLYFGIVLQNQSCFRNVSFPFQIVKLLFLLGFEGLHPNVWIQQARIKVFCVSEKLVYVLTGFLQSLYA